MHYQPPTSISDGMAAEVDRMRDARQPGVAPLPQPPPGWDAAHYGVTRSAVGPIVTIISSPGARGPRRRLAAGPGLLGSHELSQDDVRDAPLVVPCTGRVCGSGAGERCRSKGGYRNSAVGAGGFHANRWIGVSTLAPEQIRERLAQVRAARAATTAASMAQIGGAS